MRICRRKDGALFVKIGIRCCQGLKEIGCKGALSFETYNALNAFDPGLHADALEFLAATGRMFARRTEGRDLFFCFYV